MSNKVSRQAMELIDDLAKWFGEEMMRLEERDIPTNRAGREQRLREHTIIAKSNIAMLLDDIRRARQKGKNATR